MKFSLSSTSCLLKLPSDGLWRNLQPPRSQVLDRGPRNEAGISQQMYHCRIRPQSPPCFPFRTTEKQDSWVSVSKLKPTHPSLDLVTWKIQVRHRSPGISTTFFYHSILLKITRATHGKENSSWSISSSSGKARENTGEQVTFPLSLIG